MVRLLPTPGLPPPLLCPKNLNFDSWPGVKVQIFVVSTEMKVGDFVSLMFRLKDSINRLDVEF